MRNFLHNLRMPINFANNLLQADVKDAARDVGRFGLNTTVGIGGVFDVATPNGLPYKQEDFGQTLGVWGVGPGPYFVLPLLGPSTMRDTVGILVDGYADPVRIYLYNTHNEGWYYAREVVTALDKREELLGAVNDLRRNSFDFYAATRSAYLQEREAMVNDRHPHRHARESAPDIPDYEADTPSASAAHP